MLFSPGELKKQAAEYPFSRNYRSRQRTKLQRIKARPDTQLPQSKEILSYQLSSLKIRSINGKLIANASTLYYQGLEAVVLLFNYELS